MLSISLKILLLRALSKENNMPIFETKPREVSRKFKESTIAIDFDGVVHKYSQGFKGLYNAYDVPNPGTEDALKELISRGYRLVIVSSRPTKPIIEWLEKHNLSQYFDDVTNIKIPASYYVDDHAVYFNRKAENPWETVLGIIDRNDS